MGCARDLTRLICYWLGDNDDSKHSNGLCRDSGSAAGAVAWQFAAMSGSVVLLNLAGAVALLLFATRMVRTGVERAYGDVLRLRLRGLLKNPILAVGAGAALAIALQSATAVALLVGSFVGSGIVGGTSGLLAALGADLGSAIVVKLLSFNLSLLVPLCLVGGTVLFMATSNRKWLQVGRILIGIGLLILSLRLIGEASHPLRDSEFCRSSSAIWQATRSPPLSWPPSSPGCSIPRSRRSCCSWRSQRAVSSRSSWARC